MSTAIEIKPCPFCGHADVELGEPEPNRFAVDCPECGCVGPIINELHSAIDKWNSAPRADSYASS
jgi:Lar family restriction alleviation protein